MNQHLPPRKKIAIATVGRSDFGLYEPLLNLFKHDHTFDYGLIVGGAHFSELYGSTIHSIEQSGHPIWGRVALSNETDELGVSIAMGEQLKGFAEQYDKARPDLVFVLGDRYEMIAACLACVPFNIPIAHIAGGSLTLGAIDDAFRHAITKLATIHFTETAVYARRVCQMGEPPKQVFNVGSLSIDSINTVKRYSLDEFNQKFGTSFTSDDGFILVTYHPETRKPGSASSTMKNIISVLEKSNKNVLYTYPNADAEGGVIINLIAAAVARNTNHFSVPHLGTQGYYSALEHSHVVMGNSSSGIMEAACFKRAVVNIGDRQKNRLVSSNVIHSDTRFSMIESALLQAESIDFQNQLKQVVNLYGDGNTAKRIVCVLKNESIFDIEPNKSFTDLAVTDPDKALYSFQ